MLEYNIPEAQRAFPELIAKALAGEEVWVLDNGKPAIKFSPATRSVSPSDFIGFMRTPYHIAPDFNVLPKDIADAFGA